MNCELTILILHQFATKVKESDETHSECRCALEIQNNKVGMHKIQDNGKYRGKANI